MDTSRARSDLIDAINCIHRGITNAAMRKDAKTMGWLTGNSDADCSAIDRQASKVNALSRQNKTAEAKAAAERLAEMENEYGKRHSGE